MNSKVTELINSIVVALQKQNNTEALREFDSIQQSLVSFVNKTNFSVPPKKYKEGHEQLKELVESFGITMDQFKRVRALDSFHDMTSTVYQRTDTGQYMIIEQEDHWGSSDDYFKWWYITAEQLNPKPKEPPPPLLNVEGFNLS